MWHIRLRPLILSLLLVRADGALAEEAAPSPIRLVALEASDTCGFFRSQAYGQGLTHFSIEMLWACEAIAERRSARMPLDSRLAAADEALRRYHAAMGDLARLATAERRRLGWNAPIQPLSQERRAEIAEETGVFAALEAIRAGY